GATVTPALSPAFAPAVFEYTTTVAADVFTVTATPTLSDTNAVAWVNGVPVTSGTPSGPIDLVVGTTVITTAVTAQDGLTTRTYTVTVTRPPTCMATPDDGATAFGSYDAGAVQQAADVALAGATVKVAGDCRGVQTRGGETQTLYISQTLTVEGGYSFTDWAVSYPVTQPTTLDAQSGGRVIYATVPVTIANLAVQNGSGATYGGGIYAGQSLALSDVQVLSNTAVSGGGAFANASATVTGGRFENNTTSGDGGGLRAVGAATVTGATFVGNTAATAGGALFDTGSTVANTNFVGNSTVITGSAGGGYFNGIAALTNVTFTLNTAGSAGGGGAVFANAAALLGGEFVSNTAAYAGGGAYFNGAASLTGTRIDGNTATADRGGGAYFNSTAILSATTFAG
ncbi:MAG: cadherin-like beta sandwich domain-containing protein, partial [Caldilinea sp.]|nr:cadherin-like beta sandwich domain-containing protein [Caldilinea sp.]